MQQDILIELTQMGFPLVSVEQALLLYPTKEKALSFLLGQIPSQIFFQSAQEDWEEEAQQSYKLVILVRMDLKLSFSNIVKGVAIGALRAYKIISTAADSDQNKQFTLHQWLQSGQRKIVLKINSQLQLQHIYEKARAVGINLCFVMDQDVDKYSNQLMSQQQIQKKPISLGQKFQNKIQISKQIDIEDTIDESLINDKAIEEIKKKNRANQTKLQQQSIAKKNLKKKLRKKEQNQFIQQNALKIQKIKNQSQKQQFKIVNQIEAQNLNKEFKEIKHKNEKLMLIIGPDTENRIDEFTKHLKLY